MKLRLSVAVGVGVLAATFAGLLFHLFLKKCCALRMATRLRFRIAVVASILVGVGVSISAAKSSRRLRPDPLVLQQDRRFYDGNSGACAVVCHLDGANLTTAWAGDCRAILGVKSPWTILRHDLKADELTRDHQISTNPEERARLIRDHPGEVDVVHRNRVKGRLEPTRAFGDGKYKSYEFFNAYPRLIERYRETGWTPPYVTAEPEVSQRSLNSSCKFLVIACDGLFQDLSSQEVVDEVAEFMRTPKEERKGHNAATWLTERALAAAAKPHCTEPKDTNAVLRDFISLPQGRSRRHLHDDITVQVVFFDHEQQYPPQAPSNEKIETPETLKRYREFLQGARRSPGVDISFGPTRHISKM